MEIGQEFVSYFTSLLSTEVPTLPVDNAVFNWGPKLSSELALELCRVVTPEEVKQAIFHISDNKAPGPDGYSACFFKRAWHIVGDQVCTAVLDFFRSGRLLRQLNHSIIALVPKSDHCPTVADYRPISCCNVIYKAITKIIADRLATALEHLTDRCQAAFVGGRSITDNIFLAQELVRQYTRKRISPRVQLMLTQGIRLGIVDLPFTVALNGSLHGFLRERKGLDREDPMSPGLFLLCMEYFSRLIKRKTTDSDFNFHPKCEKLKITHLLFADDLMMFSRGDLPSVHILMECLQEFGDVSGLAVNTSKSSIFTAGIENNILCDILARTEFTRGEMPVRYLGIPLAHRGCRLGTTRRSLIKLPTVFPDGQQSPSLLRDGGLGIRHIQTWNVALLARVLWNIHRKADTLWVQWVGVVYLKGGSVWDWQPKKGDSPLLQRLAEIRSRIITAFGSPEAAIEHMAEWSSSKGLDTSKYMSTSGRNEQNSLGRRLSTRDRLMFLQEDSSCSLCINTQETAKHLFFECPFSNFVWTNIRQWLGINRRMSTLLSAVKWLIKEKMRSSVQNKARLIALACTVYSLWRHRNEVIFEGKTPCPEGLVISIRITVYRILLTLFPHELIMS
ncbi:UNVERIFIED_CONTAM: hypothetical protein Sangu_2168500 [Sesamum angustifolium]|uniref:Reverse transcriptase domain-containing protein n=1 Tax=Sesamum angustifolium TaxID=2727405 RepID=A0AAW2LG37_9LAMI